VVDLVLAKAKSVEGSGLGLTLVQHIVMLHGEDIIVRSRDQQGTEMTVRLPIVQRDGANH